MHDDADWTQYFLEEPVLEGVEGMTRDETVLRVAARVRPGQQWRVAREMRRRIREELDRLGMSSAAPAAE
jgi:small conductance mechanosensitive channel